MKKLCLFLAIIILPVSAFAGWFYGSQSASGVWTDDFNRTSIGADWDSYYGIDLTISSGRVTSTAPAMMRWVGASIGSNHSAEIQYVSGTAPLEFGVRDKVGVADKAFASLFTQANGALPSPWVVYNVAVSSNAVALSDSVENGVAQYVSAAIGSDQFSAITATVAGSMVGASVRGTDDGELTDGYVFLVDVTASLLGTKDWYLYRYNSGTPTLLDSGTASNYSGTGQIYLTVKGTNPVVLYCSFGNLRVARVEDSSASRIASGGYPGFAIASGSTAVRADNWAGGDISGADQRYWVLWDDGVIGYGESLDKDPDIPFVHVWTLLEAEESYSPVNGDKIKISVDGTTITVTINGSEIFSGTDDLIPESLENTAPILGFFDGGTLADNWRVEEFE